MQVLQNISTLEYGKIGRVPPLAEIAFFETTSTLVCQNFVLSQSEVRLRWLVAHLKALASAIQPSNSLEKRASE